GRHAQAGHLALDAGFGAGVGRGAGQGHFLAVGHDLYRHYGERYIRQGRYLLSGGILAGGFFSRLIDLASHVEAILFAFVAGAMILNIIKFELPADRNLHFRTFVLAVVGYGGILLFLKHVLNF
ncbi:MAG: hypothetical protein ACK411_13530, partial [Exiguobacterium mexicanum]